MRHIRKVRFVGHGFSRDTKNSPKDSLPLGGCLAEPSPPLLAMLVSLSKPNHVRNRVQFWD
jgi:hypothetical protein